jgi:hypothetical protein
MTGENTKGLEGPPTTTYARTVQIQIGDQWVNTSDMPRLFGFTDEERRAQVDRNEQLRTYCTLGHTALTAEEFMRQHPHVELGYN